MSGAVAALVIAAALPAVAPPPPPAVPTPPAGESLPGMRADVAALIVQGIEGGNMPLAARALEEDAVIEETPPGSPGAAVVRWRLPLMFEVAWEPLRPPPGAEGDAPAAGLGLELYAYAVGEDGAVAGYLARALPLAADERAAETPPVGVRFVDELLLPPGRFSLRALAFAPASGKFGLVLQDVELPPPAPHFVGAPRLPDRCSAWLVAGAAAGAVAESAGARPVVAAGERVRLSVAARADSAAPPPDGGALAAEIRAARRAAPVAATPSPVPLAPLAAHRRDDLVLHTLALEVPDLATGIYELTVVAGGQGAPRSRPLEIWILGRDLRIAAAEPCERTWPLVFGRAAERFRAGAVDLSKIVVLEESIAETRARLGPVRSPYLRTLREFAAGGDPALASGRLAALEARLVGADPLLIRPLRAIQLEVARDLKARDSQTLLPLLMLHHEAFQRHFEQGRFALATHSRELTLALASLAARSDPDERWHRLLGDLLASLAEVAARHRMWSQSAGLLEGARQVDPGNPAVRLLLAIDHEWHGRPAEACDELRQLVTADVKNMEARLRLAVNLARIGELDESERLVRAIILERPTDWILALAFQTLADGLGRRGRYAEAAGALEHGIELLPGEQGLRLQLSYFLDRAGRPSEAAATLAALPGPPTDPGSSPRLRYTAAPTSALEPVRDRLGRSVTLRLPRLGRAAAALAGGGDRAP